MRSDSNFCSVKRSGDKRLVLGELLGRQISDFRFKLFNRVREVLQPLFSSLFERQAKNKPTKSAMV